MCKTGLCSLRAYLRVVFCICRFLSSGLIFHDTMAVVFFTVRKFCDNNTGHIVLHVFGVGFTFLAYITIGIMSLERLVVFHSPNFYLRNFTATKVKRWVCVLWLISIIIYYFTRYGACYLIVENATIYDVLGECNVTSFTLFGLTIIIVIILSLICYAKIFLIVWNEVKKSESNKSLNFTSTARSLKQYKSTTLVFVYLIAVILTGLAYVLIMLQGLDTKPLRLYLDAVNTCNCLIDPCLYVLWFRECRMEMLKMVSFLLPRLSDNVEKMRLNVFEVVTSRKFSRSFGRNRTEPVLVTSPDTTFTICELGVYARGK